MLRDKINKTQELMMRAKEAQSIQERHRRSIEFAGLVKEKLPPLLKEVQSVRLVEQIYPNQWQLPPVEETLRGLKELMDSIEQEPRVKFGNVLRSFEPFQREVKSQWPAIVKKQHQDSKKALLVFRRIRKDDTQIERMLQNFDSLEKLWPVTEKNLTHYQNTLLEAKHFISSLGAGVQIQQFLEKMAIGQATLDDMNDEVLQWIRAQGLTSQVYISFK